MLEKDIPIPQLPYHEDFYYSDADGNEVPYEADAMVQLFAEEVEKSKMEEEDKQRIFYALDFAIKAHRNQLRRERSLPYIIHPVEAALIALRKGYDVTIVVALLLHDIEEETDEASCKLEGEDATTYKRLIFRGNFVAHLVDLLTRKCFVWNKKKQIFEKVKKDDSEYYDRIKGSSTATKAKHCDTSANLNSDARRLEDECLKISYDDAQKIIANIKRYIGQVEDFLVPIEKDVYESLYKETETRIIKIKTRMQIVEAWLHQFKVWSHGMDLPYWDGSSQKKATAKSI